MSKRTDGAPKGAPLPSGDPRRLSDARCAWRKMTDLQRRAFLRWINEQETENHDHA